MERMVSSGLLRFNLTSPAEDSDRELFRSTQGGRYYQDKRQQRGRFHQIPPAAILTRERDEITLYGG